MGILAKYTFNGDANDKVGSANGTVTNGSYKRGINNSALEFPSTNNGYCHMGNNFNFTTQDFTFSFLWYGFSFTTSTVGEVPISIFKGAYNTKGYYGQISSTYITLNTNQASALQNTTASLTISLNKWYYITYTRSGSSVRIYVNGVDKTTTAGSHINPASSSDNFQINRYQTGYTIIGNTKYDEFIVEQRKWIASEIKNKYSYYKGFF